MSLKFGRIQPWTAELAALTNLKNLLLENYSKYFDDLLSGERSLTFGLLVLYARNLFACDCINEKKDKQAQFSYICVFTFLI